MTAKTALSLTVKPGNGGFGNKPEMVVLDLKVVKYPDFMLKEASNPHVLNTFCTFTRNPFVRASSQTRYFGKITENGENHGF